MKYETVNLEILTLYSEWFIQPRARDFSFPMELVSLLLRSVL